MEKQAQMGNATNYIEAKETENNPNGHQRQFGISGAVNQIWAVISVSVVYWRTAATVAPTDQWKHQR